jgi:hypothetical protein
MPDAAGQVQRNREVVAARAGGETISALALRFGLSKSRVKQLLREAGPPSATKPASAMELALERRHEYAAAVHEIGRLARRLPESQPAPKVGAYRALLDALDRLTALERALGFLPNDVGRLKSERALVEAVFAVFTEHEVPDEARRALVARLETVEPAA